MADLIAIVGSVTPPGRLLRATEGMVERARAGTPGLQAQAIDLAGKRIAFADGRPPEALGDDTAEIVNAITEAGAVVLASPVYRASFSGSLKNLLDHVPAEALANKPVGILAMGATAHHYLGVDRHLRDILSWYGALVAPTSVYLMSNDFHEGELSDNARADLDALAAAVLRLRGAAEGMGPVPLALRRG